MVIADSAKALAVINVKASKQVKSVRIFIVVFCSCENSPHPCESPESKNTIAPARALDNGTGGGICAIASG
jgi:hypothetical protein